MRVVLDHEPFTDLPEQSLWERGRWPAHWVAPTAHAVLEPQVLGWRLRFRLEAARTLRVHVSADERYELFLDGEAQGRGAERGDLAHWHHETYDLTLAAGEHLLAVRTWWLGSGGPAPLAQFSRRPALLVAAEGAPPELVNTGHAGWQVRRLDGYRFLPHDMAWGTGAKTRLVASEHCWGWETGAGDGWMPAAKLTRAGSGQRFADGDLGWFLRPSPLPAMREERRQLGRARHVDAPATDDTARTAVRAAEHHADEAAGWDAMLAGRAPLTVPARTRRRVIIDLGTYLAAYSELSTTGGAGASVRVRWSEALFAREAGGGYGPKGHRGEVEGKWFAGAGDVFEPDGGERRRFVPLWWLAGRYVEVLVTTADAPLTIDSLAWRETGYPWRWEGAFEASDPRLAAAMPAMLRTLEACTHETYMDCPFYEQLMYVGDTRLEVLASYAMSRDARLPRKAIALFDWSRGSDGLTASRYPSFPRQVIPPFSLWWVGMVRDWLWWRDEPGFARSLLPGVRGVIDHFWRCRDARGVVRGPEGWNYMDWVPAWRNGMPPGGDIGEASAPLHWHVALTLAYAAELEDAVGEPELADLHRRRGRALAEAAEAFWDETRGLYADDEQRTSFSEHAQCLALLGGFLPEARRVRVARELLEADGLHRTTIYFNHYLFEVLARLGRTDRLIERMDTWFALPDLGLHTTLESPEPSRSDCHAWGAHPLWHYLASILGMRPAAPGFASVRITPCLGPLAWARGTLAHPRGLVRADLRAEGGRVLGQVTLPEGVDGVLVQPDGSELALRPGANRIA